MTMHINTLVFAIITAIAIAGLFERIKRTVIDRNFTVNDYFMYREPGTNNLVIYGEIDELTLSALVYCKPLEHYNITVNGERIARRPTPNTVTKTEQPHINDDIEDGDDLD